jgi:hypothetical protein
MYLDYLVQIFFIIAPVFVGGIFFIFSLKKNYFSILNKPIDFNYKIFNKRFFGENKTFRGILLIPLYTYIFIIFTGLFLELLGVDLSKIIFDYSFKGSFKGLLYGLAYSLGELPNSFIKRQIGIGPGAKSKNIFLKYIFKIIDNIDSLVACSFVLFFVYGINFNLIAGAFFTGVLLHFGTDLLMKKIKLKK